MGDDDPFGSFGLAPIRIEDKAVFDQAFQSCSDRLSDYSFANTFIWRQPIHLQWARLHDCLCVFANGDGGLTLLFPPIGPGDSAASLREALRICDEYNGAVGLERWTRVEYVSREMLDRLSGPYLVEPMSGDYVYATERMVDLAGGDLASKRQARNRFARRYAARTETYDPALHLEGCLGLLRRWEHQADEETAAEPAALAANVAFKRSKDMLAAEEALRHHARIGLTGMALYAGNDLVGFTFGEMIGRDIFSVLVEKTDREYVGSAQYIFSEFCRQYWAHTRWCNAGDDWDIPALAWTKESYRPVRRLDKFVLRPIGVTMVPAGGMAGVLEAASCASASLPSLALDPSDRLETVFSDLEQAATLPMHAFDPNRRLETILNEMDDAAAALAASPGPVLPEIDRAAPTDLDDLTALEAGTFEPGIAVKRRQLRYLLQRPTASVHVVRCEGKVAAAAMLLRRRTRNGTVGRVYSLAVDASHRGKGYGKSLLRSCIGVLQAEGISSISLEVEEDNIPAVRLYESLGFHTVRRLVGYYGAGRDGLKMRLDIPAPDPAPAPVCVGEEAGRQEMHRA